MHNLPLSTLLSVYEESSVTGVFFWTAVKANPDC